MSKILSGINRIVPKRKIIIFNSFPDISGNSLALYEYIIKNRLDIVQKYKLIWNIGEMSIDDAVRILQFRTGKKKHIVKKKRSIKGIMLFFLSQYIISTHGYFPNVKTSKNQIHINLWHGMPFKKIGRLLKENDNKKTDEADITIASSEVFQRIMAKAFAIERKNVLITGQPCADLLIKPNNALKLLRIDKRQYKKIIMWMPTFRISTIGHIHKDGKEDSFGVSDVLDNHFNELNMCLIKKKYLLIIKLHSMDKLSQKKYKNSENIKVYVDSNILGKGIQIYELLSNCDCLLTDYSSVFIDFLVTKKPIAFICSDLNEYENTRGFCFAQPRKYMPGELITNFKKLKLYIKDMDEYNNKWKLPV